MDKEAEVRGGWMSDQSEAVLLPSHDFQEKPHLTQLMNMTEIVLCFPQPLPPAAAVPCASKIASFQG